MKIKYERLILSVILLLCFTGCSTEYIKPINVSILDYTEKYEDLVSDKNYLEYEIGNNKILLDPKDENRIFIIKNNKIIALLDEGYMNIFSSDFSYPLENNVIIQYSFQKSFMQYNSKNEIYYDRGLNGIDIELERKPFLDELTNLGASEIRGRPEGTIRKAIIDNKQCVALVGTSACCSTDKGAYEAYNFDYDKGWEKAIDNKKLMQHCNSNDIDKTREELIKAIYDN